MFVSFSRMFGKVVGWLISSPRAIGLPEQDMTGETKTPLSHNGGDPWEGAVGWSHVLSDLQHSCVGAIKCIFYCLC